MRNRGENFLKFAVRCAQDSEKNLQEEEEEEFGSGSANKSIVYTNK